MGGFCCATNLPVHDGRVCEVERHARRLADVLGLTDVPRWRLTVAPALPPNPRSDRITPRSRSEFPPRFSPQCSFHIRRQRLKAGYNCTAEVSRVPPAKSLRNPHSKTYHSQSTAARLPRLSPFLILVVRGRGVHGRCSRSPEPVGAWGPVSCLGPGSLSCVSASLSGKGTACCQCCSGDHNTHARGRKSHSTILNFWSPASHWYRTRLAQPRRL